MSEKTSTIFLCNQSNRRLNLNQTIKNNVLNNFTLIDSLYTEMYMQSDSEFEFILNHQ